MCVTRCAHRSQCLCCFNYEPSFLYVCLGINLRLAHKKLDMKGSFSSDLKDCQDPRFQSTRCENHTACEPCEWQVSRRRCRRDTEYIGMQRRAKLLKIRLEFSSSMTWNQSAVLCLFRIYAQNWSHLSTMVKHRHSDDLPNWWYL